MIGNKAFAVPTANATRASDGGVMTSPDRCVATPQGTAGNLSTAGSFTA